MKGTRKSPKGTTRQAAKKAAAGPGPRADKADRESAVLAKIAAMPEPDRALGERLQHEENALSLFFFSVVL